MKNKFFHVPILVILAILLSSCGSDDPRLDAEIQKETERFNNEQEFHDGLKLFATYIIWEDDDRLNIKDGEFGYINREGDTVIPPHERNLARDFSGGLVMIKGNAYDRGIGRVLEIGYMNTRGEIVIPVGKYDARNSTDFKNGFALVHHVNGVKFSYINKQGEAIFTSSNKSYYNGMYQDYSEGMAGVYFDESSDYGYLVKESGHDRLGGYINVRGEVVIKPQFTSISPFEDGRALVKIEGGRVYVDKFGNFTSKNGIIDEGEDGCEFGYIDYEEGGSYMENRIIGWNWTGSKSDVSISMDVENRNDRILISLSYTKGDKRIYFNEYELGPDDQIDNETMILELDEFYFSDGDCEKCTTLQYASERDIGSAKIVYRTDDFIDLELKGIGDFLATDSSIDKVLISKH